MSTPLFVLVLALCLSTGLCLESFKVADGYEVFPAYNTSRYKLYLISLKWLDAVYLCQGDQGDSHLLIINSEQEAEVARELMGRLTGTGLLTPWAGINDIETERRWVTVKGGLVSASGYNKWRTGSPSATRAWNCGTLLTNALYDDWPCTSVRPFICEKPNV